MTHQVRGAFQQNRNDAMNLDINARREKQLEKQTKWKMGQLNGLEVQLLETLTLRRSGPRSRRQQEKVSSEDGRYRTEDSPNDSRALISHFEFCSARHNDQLP